MSSNQVKDSVKEYYGKILGGSKDLKTSACTASGRPSRTIRDLLSRIPQPVKDRFYGCGTPLPNGGLEGLSVLDLGCGSGRDCYLASALVGETGMVTGIDMTKELLDVAGAYADSYCKSVLGYKASNVRFLQGYIEDIEGAGVAKGSQDLIISNCVINLSPDKPSVIRGMFETLRQGGEVYFSDVYSDRRLPQDVQRNKVLWGECLSGALYVGDFLRIARSVGFSDPRELERVAIKITDPELADLLGNAQFFSITYRLFKLEGLETSCEDYGQVATYLGTFPGQPHLYKLDDRHLFETGRPVLVCGNTARMLGESWIAEHFKVVGDKSIHFGLFPCDLGLNQSQSASQPLLACATSGSGGTCC